MAEHRCYISTCSQDVLQQILEHLSCQDKAKLSLTCKAFQSHRMVGTLEVHLPKQEQARQRSLCTLIHLLEGMSAAQKCKIRTLRMHTNSVGIAALPDLQQHRICRAVIENLTVLWLHDVYLRLDTLEVPGVKLRLEVLDLSGSVLVAKANPKNSTSKLEWPLLTSNSSSLRCLILRNVLVHVPRLKIEDIKAAPLEHVVLPRLEQLDIVEFGVVDYKPSGYENFQKRREADAFRDPCRTLPPQSFKGAPSLTLLHFTPICPNTWRNALSTWDHFLNLRSVELNLAPWCTVGIDGYAASFKLLPPSLTELQFVYGHKIGGHARVVDL